MHAGQLTVPVRQILLQQAGITPAVITGRDSPALRLRLAALGVVHARFGTEDKRPAAEAILAELGLAWGQAAAMGDDWPDLAVMRRAAFACAAGSGDTVGPCESARGSRRRASGS